MKVRMTSRQLWLRVIAAALRACCLLAGFTYSVWRPGQKCVAVRHVRATMYSYIAI
jgi:hypothetical protein